MPGIAFGDWGEMQTVPHVLGVAHPTGYPTYILLAWLAELVPLGSVAFRANLLSAIYVAGAVATTVLICVRLGVRPWVAAAAGLALGATGTVWAAATVAEVNPLHLLFAALILHRALAWQARRTTVDLALGGLLLGLALGNHLLTLFIAPFVALFALWAGRDAILARPVILLVPIGTLLLGLAVYLYIPLAAAANPPLPYNHPVTLDTVVWLVTGEQFRGQFDFLSSRGPAEFAAALPALWDLLASRATPVLPVLGAIGLGVMLVRRTAFGLGCLGILLTAVYIWANYLQLEHYLLVPFLILAIGAGVAVEFTTRAVLWLLGRATASRGPLPGRVGTALRAAVAIVALVGSLALAATNEAGVDRSDDRSGQEYVEAVFGSLPANAAILSYWDASTPLWHGQLVERLRSDVLVVDDTNIVYEGWVTRERRIESLICGRPVFILRLSEIDLLPTRQEFRLTRFLDVRVAAGEPSASVASEVYRVEPLDPGAC